MSKILLVVGHNSKSRGAVSNGVSEWLFFKEVCKNVIDKMKSGVVDVAFREPIDSYSQQMQRVVDVANAGKYNLVLELHFNSAGVPEANGSEVLCYDSTGSRAMATKMVQTLSAVLGTRNRGILPKTKASGGNGLYGIVNARSTWLLLETHFGSNPEESKRITPILVADALIEFISNL